MGLAERMDITKALLLLTIQVLGLLCLGNAQLATNPHNGQIPPPASPPEQDADPLSPTHNESAIEFVGKNELAACHYSYLDRHEDQCHKSRDDEVHAIKSIVIPSASASYSPRFFARLVGGGTFRQRVELFNRDR